MSSITEIISSFRELQVLILGDVVLDRYWWGAAHRLSPEAPVPVLLKQRSTVRPGGAANTAANAVALGARAQLIGIVGQDPEADELRIALAAENISHELVTAARRTTTKTRLIAGHHHIVRVDDEDSEPITDALADQVLAVFRAHVPNASAVLISDYAKGLLIPELLKHLIDAAKRAGIGVYIDPKGSDFKRYQNATLLKPNRLELGLLVGRPIRNHAETLTAGHELRDLLAGTDILVTEAADGMSFFGSDGTEFHTASESRQVFDITGAGDTVLSAFSLARTANANPLDAMRIASLAAGISISSLGAATVTPAQLFEALSRTPKESQ